MLILGFKYYVGSYKGSSLQTAAGSLMQITERITKILAWLETCQSFNQDQVYNSNKNRNIKIVGF